MRRLKCWECHKPTQRRISYGGYYGVIGVRIPLHRKCQQLNPEVWKVS